MQKPYLTIILLFSSFLIFCQDSFDFDVELEAVSIEDLPGLHSYAFAQHNGLVLLVGGRLDGLHARQPFNSFPEEYNNTSLYVLDIENRQYWSATVEQLPINLKEQLQSTNMNFHQSGDTLYIIGGYAYSASADDHITFPYLTTIQVSATINAIISNQSFTSFIKQIYNDLFAVCGGQIGMLSEQFYLVGGHRFDGRYNPMGHPTYSQTYTDAIRIFEINNSGPQPEIVAIDSLIDTTHLHRRDYNLLPQIFPDGTEGYTISAGVFQKSIDLPYLYPVNISEEGIEAITNFDQYLSHYHSAKVAMFDSEHNQMHNLFFGGMAQFYYSNGTLVQDDLVPFVKTISRLSRYSDGSLHEFNLTVEMPGLKGASSEFIPNLQLPHHENGIIKLSEISSDTIVIGSIFGGIYSPTYINPFSINLTNTTSAYNQIYTVKLIRTSTGSKSEINITDPNSFTVFPNPAGDQLFIRYESDITIRSIRILSTHGITISSSTNLDEGGQINISSLPVGIYFLSISTSKGDFVKRFIKN